MQQKLKVIILTSSLSGTASYFIPRIFENANVEIVSVVVNENKIPSSKKSNKKKIQKILKIGVLGAINGIRMRKWFGVLRDKYLPQISLIDYCKKNEIKIEYTPCINCNTTVDLFSKAHADVGISMGNSYIGKKVFSIPRLGMINTHGEILPEYQNAQSVIWQLYNNNNHTGYTIHKINSKIDQGEIIFQEKFEIVFKNSLAETIAFNCAAITINAADGMVKVLNNFLEYYKNSKVQGAGNHYTTPSFWQFLTIWKNYKSLKKATN